MERRCERWRLTDAISAGSVLLIIVVFGIAKSAHVAAQPGTECTQAQAEAAEKALDRLSDWSEVYQAFKKFRQCDDGAIAEGWSAATVRLLTDRWNTVRMLARLTSRDKAFRLFVLRHVDELMSPEQARQILANARTKCPATARNICRALEAKAR